VAAYAALHAEEVAYLSARELGKRCGVSESTVIRAAQEQGYRGYPEYQLATRRLLAKRRTTVERFEARAGTDPLERGFSQDLDNLRRTWAAVSPEAFDRAAELLTRAPRVWALAQRTPHAVAVLLKEGLGFLGVDAQLVAPGVHDLWDALERVRGGDLVVAVTFPRYTRQVVDVAREAKRKGAALLAISDGPASPLARHADMLLPAAYAMEGYLESFTASVCLVQALLLEVSRKLGPRALGELRHRETLWSERGVYWE
jgi:DNA-binding MurR/RpiR family transcriptional regulator